MNDLRARIAKLQADFAELRLVRDVLIDKRRRELLAKRCELQLIKDVLDKQRPKIKTPAPPPRGRPRPEATVLETTTDSTYFAQYPRAPSAANNADPYFDSRAGTKLPQRSQGVRSGRDRKSVV